MTRHRYNPTNHGWGSNPQCLECGDTLGKWARMDKLFCGDNCRKAHSRRYSKVIRILDRMESDINEIQKFLDTTVDQDKSDQVRNTLASLQAEIKALTKGNNEDEPNEIN